MTNLIINYNHSYPVTWQPWIWAAATVFYGSCSYVGLIGRPPGGGAMVAGGEGGGVGGRVVTELSHPGVTAANTLVL